MLLFNGCKNYNISVIFWFFVVSDGECRKKLRHDFGYVLCCKTMSEQVGSTFFLLSFFHNGDFDSVRLEQCLKIKTILIVLLKKCSLDSTNFNNV